MRWGGKRRGAGASDERALTRLVRAAIARNQAKAPKRKPAAKPEKARTARKSPAR